MSGIRLITEKSERSAVQKGGNSKVHRGETTKCTNRDGRGYAFVDEMPNVSR